MSTPNPFTAGCIDCNGEPIPNATPNFLNKDRIFDPTNMPRYANDLGLPSLLLRANPILKVLHLHLGPDFGGKHTHNGILCAEQDTVVMVVGAREIRGKAAGARWFGENSKYNRQSHPNNESIDTQIITTTCAGCNAIREITSDHPRIKKAFIMTSSEALIDGVKNLFLWTKNGFPDTVPQGTFKMCLGLLRDHLQSFDASGVEVKFWKVAPEFITGPTFQAECSLLDFFNVPPTGNPETCTCGNCMDDKQYAELIFAKFGYACRKDAHGLGLAQKYGSLKKGEKFVITNNADITTPTVTMRVDGKGMVFCSDGTAKHIA